MPTYKDVQLISAATLKQMSFVDDNLSEKQISAAIDLVQDIDLTNALGIELMTRIKTEVFAENITEAIKTLLDDHIRKVITYGVMARIQVPIANKIRNMGVTQDTDTNVNHVAFKDVSFNSNYYVNITNSYIDGMKLYICKNNTEYPEYYNTDRYNRKTDNNYNCPITL